MSLPVDSPVAAVCAVKTRQNLKRCWYAYSTYPLLITNASTRMNYKKN